MTTRCPVCGSEKVRSQRTTRSLPVPYGPDAAYDTALDTCDSCGETGDFSEETDDRIEAALAKSTKASVEAMFAHLASEGVSLAYFERALRLPARTTARWKSGELSASALALLRLVRTFPWLLKVADANFAVAESRSVMMRAAFDVVSAAFQPHVSYVTASVEPRPGAVDLHASFKLHPAMAKPALPAPTRATLQPV